MASQPALPRLVALLRTTISQQAPRVHARSLTRQPRTSLRNASSTTFPRRAAATATPKPAAAASPPTPPAKKPSPPAAASTDQSSQTSSSPSDTYTDPLPSAPEDEGVDWFNSYRGIAAKPFSKEVSAILMQPLDMDELEVKPDGIVYLPEIKYRRILNKAFGPGGWGLVPRGDVVVGEKIVTREYALICEGRFVSQAQGENGYFSLESLPSAVEGCKSNALMRCCKDIGIASELWDPNFLREYKKTHMESPWCEHVTTKRKKQIWIRRGVDVGYPYKRC